MRSHLLAIAPLLLSACAVTSTEYSRNGFYAGASIIGAVSNFDEVQMQPIEDTEVTPGWGARAGFRFLDRFAIEGAYEGGEEFEFDSAGVDVEMQSLTLQGKFYLTTGAVQLYGMVGVGYLDPESDTLNVDDSEPLGRLGAGLEMYLTPSLPIFIEVDYTKPTGDLEELEYAVAQAGVLVRF